VSKVQEVILRALSGRQSWLQVADVLGVSCGIGSWGGPRPSMGDYMGVGPTRGDRRRRGLVLPTLRGRPLSDPA